MPKPTKLTKSRKTLPGVPGSPSPQKTKDVKLAAIQKAGKAKPRKLGDMAPLGMPTKKSWRQGTDQWLGNVMAYKASQDRTLTPMQAKGGFRPQVVDMVVGSKAFAKGAFRYASNPTSHGISSGYHEAFVVTDMTPKLQKRVKHAKGMSAMPVMAEASWKDFSQATFPESNVRPMMEAGDGARTDTARTILSGPGGSVAGHSGSGVRSTGQAAAHDVLRAASMAALQDVAMTPAAMAVTAAAATVFTMAPGALASRAEGAEKLKDKRALATWEEDRNQAKERLAQVHGALGPAEKTVVRRHFQALAISVGGTRTLDPDQPSSPRRSTTLQAGNAVAGGGYDGSQIGGKASKAPPASGSARDITQYVSEPFRVDRS
ncbi:hypothetical protein [Polaromonas sp.]|uniref:hypothetical protein n=1 Tax=Polaromonas sp. TaxID=1869339 RepID=UPI003266A28E